MYKNISDEHALLIKEIIDGWPINEKFTWKELIKAIALRLNGSCWTRQALTRHRDIYDAYKLKMMAQKVYRGSPESVKKDPEISPELHAALSSIEKLEFEVTRLNQENLRYKEMFIIWSENAHSFNITEDMLNRQLPEHTRGKSKK